MVSVRKRGKVYEYRFIVASINGVRKWIQKSGFRTKSEAIDAGVKAYNEFINVGHCIEPSKMSYSDYLDYWMKEYFEINYKYSTLKIYKESFSNNKKKLGNYKLSVLTLYILNQVLFVNNFLSDCNKEIAEWIQKLI